MRRARTICLAVLVLATGCLVEQPIIEETDQPSRRNHPPTIAIRTPSATTLYLQRGCEVYLSVPRIDDLDENDPIVIKWFVNYEDNPEPEDTWYIDASEADGPARLLADRRFRVVLDHYPDRSVIVVEAVVSDGFADSNAFPPHRAIAPGHGSDTAVWTIIVSEGSWCNTP